MIKEKELLQEVIRRIYRPKLTAAEVPAFISDDLHECSWLMLDGVSVYRIDENVSIKNPRIAQYSFYDPDSSLVSIIKDYLLDEVYEWDEIKPSLDLTPNDADYVAFTTLTNYEVRISNKLLKYIKVDKYSNGKFYQKNINTPVYYSEGGRITAILFPLRRNKNEK